MKYKYQSSYLTRVESNIYQCQNSQKLENTESPNLPNMSQNQNHQKSKEEILLQKLATMSIAEPCNVEFSTLQKLLKESHETIQALSHKEKILEKKLSKALETVDLLKTKIENLEGKEATEKGFQMINQVLPNEMLKKILEKLDIKSLCFSRQTCKLWNDIIIKFKLMEEASSKFIFLCINFSDNTKTHVF